MENISPIPQQLFAGDTLTFIRSLAAYSAADGWVLKYVLNGPKVVEFSTTANGSSHVANVPFATTENWTPGTYTIVEAATKDGQRFTTATGLIQILANPANVAAGTDTRPHCKKMLDAIEATLEGRATTDQLKYTYNGLSIERTDILDLIAARNRYAREWAAYQRKQSGKTSRLIKARFP
ncbi:MAG: hypothetical protein J7K75_08525 [Desulfuromonas sp.]|nr:hypothetical protein [Desulfuromonas sp.]